MSYDRLLGKESAWTSHTNENPFPQPVIPWQLGLSFWKLEQLQNICWPMQQVNSKISRKSCSSSWFSPKTRSIPALPQALGWPWRCPPARLFVTILGTRINTHKIGDKGNLWKHLPIQPTSCSFFMMFHDVSWFFMLASWCFIPEKWIT